MTIDKSGANTAALNDLNNELEKAGKPGIEIRQIKYLNNLVEQDHRGDKMTYVRDKKIRSQNFQVLESMS